MTDWLRTAWHLVRGHHAAMWTDREYDTYEEWKRLPKRFRCRTCEGGER
jgi:hypothetical protein